MNPIRNLCLYLPLVLMLVIGAKPAYAEEAQVPMLEQLPEHVPEPETGPHNPYRESGTPITMTQAKESARKVRDIQVQRGELAKSWSAATVVGASQRTYKNEQEWVVTLNNPDEKDSTRKTLYIFLDLYGDVADVNFTGQ